MKVNIKDKEIELKYTLRCMMIYENITEKTFEPKGVSDILTFFYCVVIASSKDYSLKFDDFIDWIDENPMVMNEFAEWLTDTVSNNGVIKKN